MTKSVLISWLAINNDPFERIRSSQEYRLVGGKPVPGPTLTLLFDQASPYCGQVGHVVLLYRQQPGVAGEAERTVLCETIDAIRERQPSLSAESNAVERCTGPCARVQAAGLASKHEKPPNALRLSRRKRVIAEFLSRDSAHPWRSFREVV